jgi:UDP-N-acetylglucosamine 2-epimerase
VAVTTLAGSFGVMGRGGELLVMVGTRPEAIKLAPVIEAVRGRGVAVRVCATGQHQALATDALASFGIVPDRRLRTTWAGPRLAAAAAGLADAIGLEIDARAAGAIMVQGDTTTAFAGALAGFYARIPVLHVEAGLRTGDDASPYPEELHRRAIAPLATLHFAPTPGARAALVAEGVAVAAIRETGNTGIDALLRMREKLLRDSAFAAAVAATLPSRVAGRRLVLATMHRRENLGLPLANLCAAMRRLARDGDVEVILPVHPNPDVRRTVERELGDVAGVRLCAPLAYPAFVWLLDQAALVMTDSGGVQEEAPALGCPVVVLRHTTERAEAVSSGNAVLAGTDGGAVYAAARAILDDPLRHARMSEAISPFGDGRASERIAEAVATLALRREAVMA